MVQTSHRPFLAHSSCLSASAERWPVSRKRSAGTQRCRTCRETGFVDISLKPPFATTPPVGFANEGQLLLVNAASLADLRGRLPQQSVADGAAFEQGRSHSSPGSGVGSKAEGQGPANGPGLAPAPAQPQQQKAAMRAAADTAALERFRPNLVVDSDSGEPWAEDGWRTLRIGPHAFDITGGWSDRNSCSRCSMLTNHKWGHILPTTYARRPEDGFKGAYCCVMLMLPVQHQHHQHGGSQLPQGRAHGAMS